MAWITATVLTSIAALHLAWAIGWWVPIREESALARAVVGRPGIRRMPGPISASLVATALMFVALALPWPDGQPRTLALTAAACAFAVRGVSAYLPVFRRRFPEEPFATLDLRYYGPLCLAIASGLVLAF